MITTTVKDAGTLVGLKVPFNARSLRGRAFTGRDAGTQTMAGRLDSLCTESFVNDVPLYVVMSYDTPIAWYAPVRGWVIPGRKYSPTTSRHQNIVKQAIARNGEDYTTVLNTAVRS